jgi:glycosyltransferase involved in cell wall biosynthesis
LDVDKYNGKFKLLYAGTLEKYQGIDLLLSSLKHLQGVDLILLVVGGEGEQIERYKAMADELGVNGMVKFLGKVNPNDVEAYYQLADALISTRIKGTNTPLKIYKYLMSGKPVIATRIWSHTQVLNDNIAVLVEVDETDVAEKIKNIVEDREKLKEIQDNACQYVKDRFSYEEYLRLTQTLYESI